MNKSVPKATRKRTESSASPEADKEPELGNVNRGRLMAQTAASIRTIDSWWRGERVKPVTRRALEQAAKRLRIMVPHASSYRAHERNPS